MRNMFSPPSQCRCHVNHSSGPHWYERPEIWDRIVCFFCGLTSMTGLRMEVKKLQGINADCWNRATSSVSLAMWVFYPMCFHHYYHLFTYLLRSKTGILKWWASGTFCHPTTLINGIIIYRKTAHCVLWFSFKYPTSNVSFLISSFLIFIL